MVFEAQLEKMTAETLEDKITAARNDLLVLGKKKNTELDTVRSRFAGAESKLNTYIDEATAELAKRGTDVEPEDIDVKYPSDSTKKA